MAKHFPHKFSQKPCKCQVDRETCLSLQPLKMETVYTRSKVADGIRHADVLLDLASLKMVEKLVRIIPTIHGLPRAHVQTHS